MVTVKEVLLMSRYAGMQKLTKQALDVQFKKGMQQGLALSQDRKWVINRRASDAIT